MAVLPIVNIFEDVLECPVSELSSEEKGELWNLRLNHLPDLLVLDPAFSEPFKMLGACSAILATPLLESDSGTPVIAAPLESTVSVAGERFCETKNLHRLSLSVNPAASRQDRMYMSQ